MATEPNYTGTFTATSNNTSLATVALTSPPNGFTVTSVTSINGNSQTGTITVEDSHGNAATENFGFDTCVEL